MTSHILEVDDPPKAKFKVAVSDAKVPMSTYTEIKECRVNQIYKIFTEWFLFWDPKFGIDNFDYEGFLSTYHVDLYFLHILLVLADWY